MTLFLWDYDYVREKLKIPLQKYQNQTLSIKGRSILGFIGLNELNFFLNPNIYRIIKKYRKNKISFKDTIKKLKREKILYHRKKELIEIVKHDKHIVIKRRMIILMDYASVADLHSFIKIENYIF